MRYMRLGRVSFARALTLTEATADLNATTAARIATRVLAPLTGPDGVPLPGMAPLSQATFTARVHRQLVLHHGLVAQANGLTGRLLADIGGQGQQRLGAAHGPHRAPTSARKVFKGGLVSSR